MQYVEWPVQFTETAEKLTFKGVRFKNIKKCKAFVACVGEQNTI